jgi:hypothetical protein
MRQQEDNNYWVDLPTAKSLSLEARAILVWLIKRVQAKGGRVDPKWLNAELQRVVYEARKKMAKVTAQSQLTGEQIGNAIEPWVQLVRIRLFGSIHPPFQSARAAVEWIENEGEKERKGWKEKMGEDFNERGEWEGVGSFGSVNYLGVDGTVRQVPFYSAPPQRVRAMFLWPIDETGNIRRSFGYAGEVKAAMEEAKWVLEQLSAYPVPEEIKRDLESIFSRLPLSIAEEVEWEKSSMVSSLPLLAAEVEEMAGRTGFFPHSLVMYILCDSKPTLPRYVLRKWATGFFLLSKGLEVIPHRSIEIMAGDLTRDELIEAHRMLREWGPGKRQKGLTEKQFRLYHLVEEMGGVPKSGKMDFFGKVLEEWNKRYPEEKYKTVRGGVKAYDGIAAKIGADFPRKAVRRRKKGKRAQ